MNNADQYVMLISSLPKLESLFLAKCPPLSRLKLQQRLRILTGHHAKSLRLIEEALEWGRLPMTASERDVITRGRNALSYLDNEALRHIVCDRLEMRTCVAALRQRARNAEPPQDKDWGFGRWVGHITRHWSDSDFRLAATFPWIMQADQLIKESDALGLERLLLEQSYLRLQRMAAAYTFNIEAVIIYVLQWNIVERITQHNTEAAARRFEDLTQAGLSGYAHLFDKEPA